MKELLEICAALKSLDGQPCALATVIHVEGSAYRRTGARMLMTPEGEAWGMVSGGCLEHDILDHGRRALQSGRSRVFRYDSTSEDDNVFGTGLGCNGVIDVFIVCAPSWQRYSTTGSRERATLEVCSHCTDAGNGTPTLCCSRANR